MQLQPEQTKPTTSWVNQSYHRTKWIRVNYGQVVRPPNKQSSNLHLANDLVMQRRDEPIGHSFAFPLSTKPVTSNEEAGAKKVL